VTRNTCLLSIIMIKIGIFVICCSFGLQVIQRKHAKSSPIEFAEQRQKLTETMELPLQGHFKLLNVSEIILNVLKSFVNPARSLNFESCPSCAGNGHTSECSKSVSIRILACSLIIVRCALTCQPRLASFKSEKMPACFQDERTMTFLGNQKSHLRSISAKCLLNNFQIISDTNIAEDHSHTLLQKWIVLLGHMRKMHFRSICREFTKQAEVLPPNFSILDSKRPSKIAGPSSPRRDIPRAGSDHPKSLHRNGGENGNSINSHSYWITKRDFAVYIEYYRSGAKFYELEFRLIDDGRGLQILFLVRKDQDDWYLGRNALSIIEDYLIQIERLSWTPEGKSTSQERENCSHDLR
jgi:hypothetical protein